MGVHTLSFQYAWSGVDWSGSATGAAASLPSTPAAHIQRALEAFHRRFYPDENPGNAEEFVNSSIARAAQLAKLDLADRDDVIRELQNLDPLHSACGAAWIVHEAHDAFYGTLANSDFGKWYKDRHGSVECSAWAAASLKAFLQVPWPLSWHWRAILPYVREWDGARDFVAELSQVRQWELLLLYDIPTDEETAKLPQLKRDDLDKLELKRAPSFGVSHRARRWDFYRLLYLEAAEIERAVEAAARAETRRGAYSGPAALAYVLGRHDCYFRIRKVEYDGTRYDGTRAPAPIRFEVEFLLDLQPEREPLGEEPTGLDGRPYARPYELVPVPAFRKDKIRPILLASDNYCKALEQLGEVLNDPTARSVLITAPPGSGKEELARMAYFCSNRMTASYVEKDPARLHRGPLVSASLAGLEPEAVHTLLFRVEHPDKVVGPNGRLRSTDELRRSLDQTDGLVLQAIGGALFIDEIDKTLPEVRSMLLRFLESRETTIPDAGHFVRFGKDEVPQYIFAGSMARRDMFALEPVDFWTRVSHVVQMSHPLDVGDRLQTRRVTEQYILMFWRDHVNAFLEEGGHIGRDVGRYPASGLYKETVLPYFQALQKFLLSSCVVEFVADAMAETLIGPGQILPSVRRIRGAVGRSVYHLVETLLYDKRVESPIEALKDATRRRLEGKAFEEWFKELCQLLVDIGCGSGKTVTLEQLACVDRLRETVRQGAVFATEVASR